MWAIIFITLNENQKNLALEMAWWKLKFTCPNSREKEEYEGGKKKKNYCITAEVRDTAKGRKRTGKIWLERLEMFMIHFWLSLHSRLPFSCFNIPLFLIYSSTETCSYKNQNIKPIWEGVYKPESERKDRLKTKRPCTWRLFIT